jgi:hypothetical protein
MQLQRDTIGYCAVARYLDQPDRQLLVDRSNINNLTI